MIEWSERCGVNSTMMGRWNQISEILSRTRDSKLSSWDKNKTSMSPPGLCKKDLKHVHVAHEEIFLFQLQMNVFCLQGNVGHEESRPFLRFFFFTATHTYVLYGIYSLLYTHGNCTVIHYFGMGVKRSLWMSSWQWCLPPQLSDKITSPPNSIRSPLPPFRISIIITDGSLWDTHHLSPPRGPESRRAGALVMAQQKIMLSLFHCMSE